MVCGKHGLFLKVDTYGKCKVCAEKAEKEEETNFEIYYANLLHLLKDLQEVVECGDDRSYYGFGIYSEVQ